MEPINVLCQIFYHITGFYSFIFCSGSREWSVWSLSRTPSRVEGLYDKLDERQAKKKSSKKAKTKKSRLLKLIQDPSQLSRLSHFKDVAVISRKYLPKLKRFELSGSTVLVLNNAFFNNFGMVLRGAYYFSEKWGLESHYYSLFSGQRNVTKDLKAKGINTQSLVVPKNFIGASVKWIPIYGKISLFEGRIIPFDLFFNMGYGITGTEDSQGASTIHMSAGQKFAINKSVALRWDVVWNLYFPEVRRGAGRVETINHSDLYFGLGVSFFIPGAKYR